MRAFPPCSTQALPSIPAQPVAIVQTALCEVCVQEKKRERRGWTVLHPLAMQAAAKHGT